MAVTTLPETCYSTLPSTGELIIIKRGERGYYKTDYPTGDKEETRFLADERNGILEVTKAQEAAMLAGSMFGWDVPAADPASYDADGNPIKRERESE